MGKLIDYIIDQGRRLVCPVGGGPAKAFLAGPDIARLPEQEKAACWMAFQAREYGHDFLFSTMLDVHICKTMGLKTFTLAGGSEHVIENQVRNEDDLKNLNIIHPLDSPVARKYIHCVPALKRLCDKPVGGACFGPFTTAGSILGTQNLCLACVENPDFLNRVLALTSGFILAMARACEACGADFFWIAEPSGVLVSPGDFREFSGRYIKTIFQSIARPGFLHVSGNTGHLIDEFIQTGAQCLSLDHHIDLRDMAHAIPSDVSILGNINSLSMLLDPVYEIIGQVNQLNLSIRNFPNFIVGSGGGLSPDTPEENIRALFERTRHFPTRSREAFAQVDSLWHAMATNSFDEIRAMLSAGGFRREIILAGLEEACCFLGRNHVRKKICSSDYARHMRKLKKLLDTGFLNPDQALFLEGNTYMLGRLRDNFFPLIHSLYNKK